MKRILSLILVLVLVLGSMPLAFADEHMTAGESLQELGLVQGDEEGNLMEDKTLTRAEMVVMLARLNNVEDEAMVYDLPSSFSDSEDHWASSYIAYAEVQEWTDGTGDGMFSPEGEVSAQMVATFMLRVLGYEADWENAVSQAALLGIMDDNPGEAFTRANAFDMMYDAVNTKMNGSDMTLGQKLGVVAGGEPVVDVDFEVADITATNLIQAVVEFTAPVDEDSASDVDNYDIEGEDVNGDDIVIDDASLVDDMTVVLTFEVAVDQQSEYDVTVTEDVLDANEEAIDETTITVEALDNTLPTAVSAEVVGIDTIKVTFSEPVKTAVKGDFEVEEGDLYIKGVTMANNNTEANVELYSDLEEGVVSIEAQNSIEDYADFSIMSTTFDVEVVEDTEVPYVVSVKDADRREVTLVFNEDIELASSDEADFYHTNTSNEVDALPTVDGNELTLTFDEDNELPEGVAYVYIAKESINDLWDNENDTTIKTVVEITVDETAPKLVELSVEEEDEIELEFDEAVAEVDEDNFTLLDEDGEEVDLINNFTDDDEDEFVTITFDESLSGDYTLVIEDVEDLSANAVTTITEDFFVEDLTDPDFADFTATLYYASTDVNEDNSDQMIKIDFDEDMDTSDSKYSVVDLEKYTINGTVLADFEDAAITVVDSGKSIEIALPYDKDNTDDTFLVDASTHDLSMMRVADDAGNYTAAQQATIDIEASGYVTFTAAAVDTETIEVTFSDELAVFEADDFILRDASDNELTISAVSTELNSDDETVAVFTLEDEVDVDFTGSVVLDDSNANNGIESENVYGEMVALDATGSVLVADAIDIDDEIVPELALRGADDEDDVEVTSTSPGTIVMTFAEDLDEGSVSNTSFDVDGYEVDTIVAVDNVVTITLTDGDADLEIGVNIDLVGTIKDAVGNKLKELSTEIYFD